MDGQGFPQIQTIITFAKRLQIQRVNTIWKALITRNNLPKFQFQKSFAPRATCNQNSASNSHYFLSFEPPSPKNSRILPISPNPKFSPIKGGGGAHMPMLPFEAPFKGTSLAFSYSHLSNHLNPLMVLIKTKHTTICIFQNKLKLEQLKISNTTLRLPRTRGRIIRVLEHIFTWWKYFHHDTVTSRDTSRLLNTNK